MYELLYRKWSDAVHGSDIYMGKVFKTDIENIVDIVQLISTEIRFIKIFF